MKPEKEKDAAMFTFGTSFGVKAEGRIYYSSILENKHTPSTKPSSSREQYRKFFNPISLLILIGQKSQGRLNQIEQKIKWRNHQISSRRLNDDSDNDIIVPEIRFASQGRKKRRKQVNFRRNGPRIARNVFISNCVSFSKPKKNKRGLGIPFKSPL